MEAATARVPVGWVLAVPALVRTRAGAVLGDELRELR